MKLIKLNLLCLFSVLFVSNFCTAASQIDQSPAKKITKSLPVKSPKPAAYSYLKLTGEGLVRFDLLAPKKAESLEGLESFKQVSAKRMVGKVEAKKWQALQKKTELKIVVIGDTGCRLKEGSKGDEYQDCNDPKAWPFAQIIKQIKKENADLIVHLGDYHYRENCTKGKPCEKMSSVIGYGWSPWNKDFFEPAKPAFAKTPWILVRGNHEDCDRAFLGYGRLLATHEFSEGCLAYEEADFIELRDLLIVNVDSSSVSEKLETNPTALELWTQRFKEIEAKIAASKATNVWLISHKPIYGLVKMGSSAAPVNLNLRKYFESTSLKKKIQVTLAGHIHLSQIVKAPEGPLQFVLGNGGTQLDVFGEFLQQTKPQDIGLESVQVHKPGFGYVVLERKLSNQKWKVLFKNSSGATMTKCSLNGAERVCAP